MPVIPAFGGLRAKRLQVLGQPELHSKILSETKQVIWYLWLTPVILSTQEAKIRRIRVQSQPRQIV
jgi:hypothetical protein